MVYTRPTRAKNTGKRTKRLNIGNTDKYNNYKSITNDEVSKAVSFDFEGVKKAEKELLRQLNKGIFPTETYRYDKIIHNDYKYESNVIDIIEMEVPFIYHIMIESSGKNEFQFQYPNLSDRVLDALAKSSAETTIMYTYSSKFPPAVSEVEKAHEATKVVFEVPLIIPDMSAHSVVAAFDPYKYNIDEVQIDIPPLTNKEINYGSEGIVNMRKRMYLYEQDGLWHAYPKTKYDMYKALKRAFSDWGTYITMVCQNDAEKASLDKLVADGKGR